MGSRFTVHARRNLPVKEFCYLRTVNLTAAMCFGAAKENGIYGKEWIDRIGPARNGE